MARDLAHDEVVEAIYIGLTTLPRYLNTHLAKISGAELNTQGIAKIIARRLDNNSSKVMVTEMVGMGASYRHATWAEEAAGPEATAHLGRVRE